MLGPQRSVFIAFAVWRHPAPADFVDVIAVDYRFNVSANDYFGAGIRPSDGTTAIRLDGRNSGAFDDGRRACTARS